MANFFAHAIVRGVNNEILMPNISLLFSSVARWMQLMTKIQPASNPQDFREFPMTKSNFGLIKQLAYEYAGIKLTGHKQEMVYGRLSRRIRSLKLGDFDQYCELIIDRNNPEVSNFINAISTNLTAFFRELHHFEYLEQWFCKDVLKSYIGDMSSVRIWSAGCSSGEEPYSIAMTIDRALRLRTGNFDIKILATDLDSKVLAKATQGIYETDCLTNLDDQLLHGNFDTEKTDEGGVSVKDKIRRYVHFKRLNLLEEWPMQGKFDAIFCRNVVIYFDVPTKRKLFDRYANILKPNGYLFIGHSESLHGITDRFKSKGKTIYQLSTDGM